MRYTLFAIMILLIGCNERKENQCLYSDWQEYKIFNNTASIRIPESILAKRDTVQNYFELDDTIRIFREVLHTSDTLNSVVAYVYNRNLPNPFFTEYVDGILGNYMRSAKYNNSDSPIKVIDTTDGKEQFKFGFLSQLEGKEIAIGGIIRNVNKTRMELYITLRGDEFNNKLEVLECILSSFKIN